jgi:hypothetical protein
MRVFVATVMVASSLFGWGCGSSTYSTGNPVTATPSPTLTPTPATGVVTFNVVGINGAQSFAPKLFDSSIDGRNHRLASISPSPVY